MTPWAWFCGQFRTGARNSRVPFAWVFHLSLVAALAVATADAATAPGAPGARSPGEGGVAPPNVIIILADDLGYGDVAGFGYPPSAAPTPRLDRMAREGAKLTRFYVPTPYCAPTRSALLTGRYPYHTGVIHNPAPDQGLSDFGLPAEETTLAEALQGAGYATAMLGKWHLGHRPEYFPTRHGFEEYYGILYSNDMRPVQLVEQERVAEYPVVQATLTDRYTERALAFITRAQAADRPFFLYLAHAMPHKPLAASEDYWTPATPDDLYQDALRELDAGVGRILDLLSELGLGRQTLVLFMSDNGPSYGGSTGGLRGRKATTWEGGLRVPFIAWQPGTIPAGLVSAEPAAILDLMPTLLARCGALSPAEGKPLDGRDLWPLLTQVGAPSPHEAIFAMQGESLRTVTSGPWRLHVLAPGSAQDEGKPRGKDPRGPDGVTILAPWNQPDAYPGVAGGDGPRPMMLFHVVDDPSEQHDLSARQPEVVARLQALFDAEVATALPLTRFPGKGLRYIRGGDFDYEDLGPVGN